MIEIGDAEAGRSVEEQVFESWENFILRENILLVRKIEHRCFSGDVKFSIKGVMLRGFM